MGRDKRKMRVAERTGDAGEGGHMDGASASSRKRRPRSSFDAPANHTTATAPCRQSAAPARSLVPAPILSAAPSPSSQPVRLSTPLHPPALTRPSGSAQRPDTRLSQSNLLLPPLTTPPRAPTSSGVHTPSGVPFLFCRPILSADRPVLISPRPWPRPWHFLPIPGPKITAHPLRFR